MKDNIVVIHTSDLHGNLPLLPTRGEIIIDSGDFLPNLRQNPIYSEEVVYQEEWIYKNNQVIIDWIGDKKFFSCKGNHCYADVCKILQQYGVDAEDITEKIGKYKGWYFYGFPYVPIDCHPWNFAVDVRKMQAKVEILENRIICDNIDVIVAHCPPYGILDEFFGRHCGNTSLSNMLEDGVLDKYSSRPKYLLTGHIHNQYGVAYEYDMLISNAATRYNILELRK